MVWVKVLVRLWRRIPADVLAIHMAVGISDVSVTTGPPDVALTAGELRTRLRQVAGSSGHLSSGDELGTVLRDKSGSHDLLGNVAGPAAVQQALLRQGMNPSCGLAGQAGNQVNLLVH